MAKDICGKAYRLVMKKKQTTFFIPLFDFDLGKVKESPFCICFPIYKPKQLSKCTFKSLWQSDKENKFQTLGFVA